MKKYIVTVWCGDGIPTEFESFDNPIISFRENLLRGLKAIAFTGTNGIEWTFNWDHVLRFRVRQIEEEAK